MTRAHSVLIVGAGSIGERHLRCFQATGRAEVAFVEINDALRATISERYGVPGFASIDNALASRLDSSQPRVIAWDLDGELKRIHYTMAQYLHADRDSLATKGGDSWMVDAYNRIETSAQSIAKQMRQKDGTGVMRVDLMPPEVADAWMAYKAGEIDAEAVQTRLRLAQPILRLRRMSE